VTSRVSAGSATSLALAGALALGVYGLTGTAQQKPDPPPTPPPTAQAPTGQPPASGQPAEGTPQQKPVFRTGAELVRVDVAVLDKRGLPVPTLTAADFEIQEDGTQQEIRTFQFIKADGQPDADNELSLPIRSQSHAAMEAAKDNVRVFLIFWDEYHIGQLASASRARAALMQFVRTAFGPTDLVAFMDPLTTIDSLWFTRDRLELAERVRRLIGRSGIYVPTRSAVEDAHLQRGDVERLRSEVTISALKSAAVHLGGLRDGRKALIVVSEGLRGIQRDGMSLITDLVRTANDNNTAIYSLDPRGFGMQRFPSIFESVADDTGGQYFRNNDMVQSLQEVVSESSGFYLLGYAPQTRALDGKFHKIKVKVKPSNLEVRARAGYWAPSVAEVERAKTQAAASELPPDIRRALGELPSATARRVLDIWVGSSIVDGHPQVRLSWSPRASANASSATKPSQVTAVALQGETRAFDGPVDAAGASFAASPGPVKITISTQDAAGDVIDREVRAIEIPDPAASRLSLSSPAVFRAQNIREFRSMDRGPNATPYPGREFERTDRMLIRFAVNGSAAGSATVAVGIISQWGKDLAQLPFTRVTPDGNDYEIDLPLNSVARGDFLISITATSGADTSRALVPFRIVR
jgi:VWFA-related protein